MPGREADRRRPVGVWLDARPRPNRPAIRHHPYRGRTGRLAVHRPADGQPAGGHVPHRLGPGRRVGSRWADAAVANLRSGFHRQSPERQRIHTRPNGRFLCRAQCRSDPIHRRRLVGSRRRRPRFRPVVLARIVQRALHRPCRGRGRRSGAGWRCEALPGYQQQIASIQTAYRTHLAAWYRLERRWPDSPFWRRRHQFEDGPLPPPP